MISDLSNETDLLASALSNGSYLDETTLSKLLRQYRGDVEPVFMSLHLSFCMLSLLVSSVNALVLSRRSMRRVSLNVLLLALEFSNLIFALVYFPVCVIRFVNPTDMLESHYAYVSRFIYIPVSACVTFNVWMTVIIGLWRCLGVSSPLTAGRRLTRTRALVIILILACFCCFSSAASNVLTTQVKRQDFYAYSASGNHSRNISIFITVRSDVVEANPWILKKLNICLTVGFFVLPAVCLVTVNTMLGCLLCLGIASSSSRIQLREGQNQNRSVPPATVATPSVRTTIILMALTSIFLIGNASAYLPEFVQYFWPQRLTERLWPFYYPWNYILNTFVLGFVINSLSFFGYYYMSSRFRNTAKELFHIRGSRISRSSNMTPR